MNPKQGKYALLALVLLLASAAGWWLARGPRGGSPDSNLAGRPVPAPDFAAFPEAAPAALANAAVPRPGDFMLTLPPDKLANARLKIEAATAAPSAKQDAGALRTTGTVQSNALRETPVAPLTGGIVREVGVVPGDRVRAGQTLAVIFSTELSEAQTTYLSIQAESEKHHHRYRRASELVELGAISRAEFEEAVAGYKIEQARLAAARQRLSWLGMREHQLDALEGPSQMSALMTLTAPAAGTLLNRGVNPGEVVMPGRELFRIADLATVWVIAQLYEQDFAAAPVGTAAVITTPAYPGRVFTGRVTYPDPRVETQTRTAQVRIEAGNPREILKLGMFVDVSLGGAVTNGARAVAGIPRTAVQMIGARQVVYVETSQAGVFAQRTVRTGTETNGLAPVFAGLRAGERVVTEGSFLLRAESLRLDPAQLTEPSATPDAPPPEPAEQRARIVLTGKGYQPASIRLRAGIPARLTFVREVEATCGTEIVLPDYGIKKELPLHQPVVVEFTPAQPGEFSFACGMNMLRGKLVVR
ncbi:MAG: efflux RND transporter periplasmic adaptor subunit [Blastocatellia bacterium]